MARGVVDHYGSTQQEELLLVVPLAMLDPNNTDSNHPRSRPSWKTKKLMCTGIIGLTAAVASSALLFLSILDFSKQESTEPSFLLNDSGGADDDKCVAATGPWPTGSVDKIDDDDSDDSTGPYVTCFSYQEDEDIYCWSHSYYDSGDWKPCKPKGFGEVWFFTTNSCATATACTAFSKNDDGDWGPPSF